MSPEIPMLRDDEAHAEFLVIHHQGVRNSIPRVRGMSALAS